jgi:hypothetical protein
MRTPRFSILDVLTADGAARVGAILQSDAQQVTLEIDGGAMVIPRADVVRVDLVKLAGSGTRDAARRLARGAVLGGAAAALAAGVVGGDLWPPPGVVVRAGAAAGGLSGLQAALLARQGRMIYLAP